MINTKTRIGKNRPSPKNEKELIEKYKQKVKIANKKDNLDVAAVITKNGEKGHGLLNQSFNRSRDDKYHRIENFIPDKELK